MQENSSEKFSSRLKRVLRARAWLAADLARATGVSKGYISSLLKDAKPDPSIRMSAKFSEVLRCDPTWLVSGRGRSGLREIDGDGELDGPAVRDEPAAGGGDSMARIAAALERIAAAMEVANREPINYRRKENEP